MKITRHSFIKILLFPVFFIVSTLLGCGGGAADNPSGDSGNFGGSGGGSVTLRVQNSSSGLIQVQLSDGLNVIGSGFISSGASESWTFSNRSLPFTVGIGIDTIGFNSPIERTFTQGGQTITYTHR